MNGVCEILLKNIRQKRTMVDTDGEFKSVYPDKNNHTIDAVRYALEDEITKKKARVIKRSELDL